MKHRLDVAVVLALSILTHLRHATIASPLHVVTASSSAL
jgi:hypothetical protein